MEFDLDPDETVSFTCNICGHRNRLKAREFHREAQNCDGCGSNARFRGIIHALSLGLLKSSVPVSSFPKDRHVRGVGMTEWDGYAKILAQKFSFTNTFLHVDPFLDIKSDDWKSYTELDFVICTEVFEHVLQPIDIGFKNLRRMLKQGGVLVFSTPFTNAPHTTEHFPGMVDFACCQIDGEWLVVSKKEDGSYDVYDKNVVFHGGPGTVLEMRIFGQNELVGQLEAAGFSVEVLSEPALEIGYYWPKIIDRPEIGYSGLHFILKCTAV